MTRARNLVLLSAAYLFPSFTTGLQSSTSLGSTTWELATAVRTLEGIRKSAGSGKSDAPLDLLTDFYDEQTGLVSEGVWHNAMVGISCVKAAKRLRATATADDSDRSKLADRYEGWAARLGDSLWDLNWAGPGLGFRRRSSSGRWQDAEKDGAARERIVDEGENVAFYETTSRVAGERRCVSNAAACLFYSFLAELRPTDGDAAARSSEVGEVSFIQAPHFHCYSYSYSCSCSCSCSCCSCSP